LFEVVGVVEGEGEGEELFFAIGRTIAWCYAIAMVSHSCAIL